MGNSAFLAKSATNMCNEWECGNSLAPYILKIILSELYQANRFIPIANKIAKTRPSRPARAVPATPNRAVIAAINIVVLIIEALAQYALRIRYELILTIQ